MSTSWGVEGTDREFKLAVEHDRPKSWLKSVSAFANTFGGSIVFGVEDGSHEVVGIEDPQGELEFVAGSIRTRIEPLPRFDVVGREVEPGRHVVVLTVHADAHPPYYYHADGRYEAYVRNGDRSEPADPERLNELILKGSNRTWDGLDSGIVRERASFTVLKATYALRTGRDLEESDLASFGLVTDDGGRLTNAGALLADEPLVRHSRLFCTKWTGRFKDNPTDDGEFSGSLLTLLREGEAFVKRYNPLSWRKVPSDRIDLRCYSERAVTEALVNALIHRSYLELGAEVHVDVYDDCLTISSPGEMMKGPLPDDVVETRVESKRRNPVIADVFSRMHLMERRGSGLREICLATAAEDAYRPEFKPRFENGCGTFRVILPNMKYEETPQVTDQVTDQVRLLLDALGGEELSGLELMGKLGLSHRPTFRQNYLAPALEAGLVERTIPDKPQSRLQKYRAVKNDDGNKA